MEDHFLYKLRNGQLQNNKGNYRSKRVSEHKKDGKVNSYSQKHLGKLLEKVLDLQKNTLTCLEKLIAFQDRQSVVMGEIADALKVLNETVSGERDNEKTCGSPIISLKKVSSKVNIKKVKVSEKMNEKGLDLNAEKELFKTVKSMRDGDHTWSSIANYLKKEKISTLTGNGTWSPNLALYFYRKMLSQNSSI